MRISDDRYSRDLRRYNLAVRLIRHEARTQTISVWTGLSDDRVRSLCRTYVGGRDGVHAVRHRGPSPRRLGFFLRSAGMRSEAAAVAVLCRVSGVLPSRRVGEAARSLPNLTRGERLCTVYETYRAIVPASQLAIEHVILLVTALAQGDELEIGNCANCDAVILIDRLGTERRVCAACRRNNAAPMDEAPAQAEAPTSANEASLMEQQDLF